MYKLISLIVIVCLSLSQPLFVLAQNKPAKSDWSVVQTLQPEKELIVVMNDDSSVKGKLKAVSEQEIVLIHNQKERNLIQDKIKQIYLMKGRSVGKSTAIGLGIGTGTGAVVGGIIAATDGPAESGEELFPVMMLASAGAIVGTITGFVAGFRRGRTLIYESK